MQMICSDKNCGFSVFVSSGNPVNLICQKCGNVRVFFDENVSLVDPMSKTEVGKLKRGKEIDAASLRDIQESPWRRAFVLVPIMEKKEEDPPSKEEKEKAGQDLEQPDAFPKPKPVKSDPTRRVPRRRTRK